MSDSIPKEKQHLRLRDTVSIIVGIVIGVGVYETAPFIFMNLSGPWTAMGAWALGGVLSLIGALCYAELASAYPRSGGDYNYLSRAYGSWAGYLFGWMQIVIIATGSIGMMAFVFANYAGVLWGIGPEHGVWLAVAVVAVLSLTNIVGAFVGKWAQNILTLLKVVGLVAVIGVGILYAAPGPWVAPDFVAGSGSFGLAMILILYTYGGWNDAALVAAEQSDRRRNIPRALILGTVLITVLYLLINAAYILALGFEGARASRSIAADVLARPFGDWGGRIMALMVVISALGAINGQIYTSARIHTRLGEDFKPFRWLAHWSAKGASPVHALIVQAAVTLALIILVGTNVGRGMLNFGLELIGFGALDWYGYGGFDTLLRCSAPFFWLFFLMTGVALFVLRFRDRDHDRPFRVPLYPVTPLIFCGTALYMLYSSTTYAGVLTLVGGIPLFIGVILYLLFIRKRTNPL